MDIGTRNIKTLLCTVIENACRDFFNKHSEHDRRDAKSFLMTKRLDDFITSWHLDIDPEYIRRMVRDKQKRRGYETRNNDD